MAVFMREGTELNWGRKGVLQGNIAVQPKEGQGLERMHHPGHKIKGYPPAA